MTLSIHETFTYPQLTTETLELNLNPDIIPELYKINPQSENVNVLEIVDYYLNNVNDSEETKRFLEHMNDYKLRVPALFEAFFFKKINQTFPTPKVHEHMKCSNTQIDFTVYKNALEKAYIELTMIGNPVNHHESFQAPHFTTLSEQLNKHLSKNNILEDTHSYLIYLDFRTAYLDKGLRDKIFEKVSDAIQCKFVSEDVPYKINLTHNQCECKVKVLQTTKSKDIVRNVICRYMTTNHDRLKQYVAKRIREKIKHYRNLRGREKIDAPFFVAINLKDLNFKNKDMRSLLANEFKKHPFVTGVIVYYDFMKNDVGTVFLNAQSIHPFDYTKEMLPKATILKV